MWFSLNQHNMVLILQSVYVLPGKYFILHIASCIIRFYLLILFLEQYF